MVLVSGIGGSLMYAPYIVVVTRYFDKRRGLAMGISCAGSGFGAFAYPPLVEYLFSVYSFSGCMLILGALSFHPCFGATLARPLVQPHHKTKLQSAASQSKDCKQTSDIKDAKSSSPKAKRGLSQYLDLSLWKNCTFVCFAVSMGIFTMAYITSQMLVADLTIVQSGATLREGAMMASALGLADTGGRFAGGILFDRKWAAQYRRHLFNGLQFLSAITMLLWASISSYPVLMAVTIVHGLLTGMVASQRAIVLSDLIGAEHISSSFGLTVFAQGVGLVIGPLIAGMC